MRILSHHFGKKATKVLFSYFFLILDYADYACIVLKSSADLTTFEKLAAIPRKDTTKHQPLPMNRTIVNLGAARLTTVPSSSAQNSPDDILRTSCFYGVGIGFNVSIG